MAGAGSASGFIFFDDREEGLPIKSGKDGGCDGADAEEERGERLLVKYVQQSLSDGFSEFTEIMEKDLGLRTEVVLICALQVAAIEPGEVRGRMEEGEDQAPLGMEDAVELSNRCQGRRDEGER